MLPPVSVEGASLGSDVPAGGVPVPIPDMHGRAGWKQGHTATPGQGRALWSPHACVCSP